MDVKELNLEELQHEHPLTFVDLQLMHRDYIEDDDDYEDSDLIKSQNFKCICNRCDRRIDWYHRYYYKCSMLSCYYSLHKFCEEIPSTLKFQGHPSHTLFLKRTINDAKCGACLKYHRAGIWYHCSPCNYGIDLLCATFVEQHTIHHPSHPHPLILVSVKPILSECFACQKKHEGHFYQCTTCFNFLINSDCLSLPIKLSLQTQQFSHRHLLTLSYSFVDQLYDCECRICGVKLEDEHLIYKCSKCIYYVHPDCTTQRIEPSMPVVLPGLGNTKQKQNFEDSDHPNLLHLPPPDESHILSHQIGGDSCQNIRSHRISLHIPDEHPIALINNDTTTSLHDPMRRIKLLCNACSRPVTKIPFYKCCADDAASCEFVLHDWCTRLPNQIRNVAHPHTLALINYHAFLSGIKCEICGLPCNGFMYYCLYCFYFIDVNCALMPKEITHEAHANHLLTRVDGASSSRSKMECRACRLSIAESETYFRCTTCDFYLDCRCALHLPKTIRLKLDKHSLKLSYSPVEDHRSQYFCEVCEEELDPGKWFYHCAECAQSIHSACAPLILKSEQGVNSVQFEGVYEYINIKFGLVTRLEVHQHPVSLVLLGCQNDGLCRQCGKKLESPIIWKCLDCNFAFHSYHEYTPFFQESSSSSSKPFYFYGERKRMIKHRRPRTNMEFYPSEMIRPETRHWEVVDDR